MKEIREYAVGSNLIGSVYIEFVCDIFHIYIFLVFKIFVVHVYIY